MCQVESCLACLFQFKMILTHLPPCLHELNDWYTYELWYFQYYFLVLACIFSPMCAIMCTVSVVSITIVKYPIVVLKLYLILEYFLAYVRKFLITSKVKNLETILVSSFT